MIIHYSIIISTTFTKRKFIWKLISMHTCEHSSSQDNFLYNNKKPRNLNVRQRGNSVNHGYVGLTMKRALPEHVFPCTLRQKMGAQKITHSICYSAFSQTWVTSHSFINRHKYWKFIPPLNKLKNKNILLCPRKKEARNSWTAMKTSAIITLISCLCHCTNLWASQSTLPGFNMCLP